jgi:tetratricopeptide (TPR) repeat protein
VRAHSPDHAPAYLELGNALREAGRYDEAELVFGEGADRFPYNEGIAINQAWLANVRRDWPTALSRWEAVRARFPKSPWCYLGNAEALRAVGRSDDVDTLLSTAEAVLAGAKKRGLEARAGRRAELEIARARLDWPAVRRCAENTLAIEASPSSEVVVVLAQACWHLRDLDAADRFALRALSLSPTLADAVIVRAWVATDRGDAETALSCYRTLVQINPTVVRWPLKLVQLLNRFGRVTEALSELENVRKQWPDDPIVKRFLRNYGPSAAVTPGAGIVTNWTADDNQDADQQELQALADNAPDKAQWLRPILIADPERDVIVAEVSGAQTGVLVFTGGNDGFSMPLPLFDRYLAALNLTAIYLKDFNRLRYLRGIRSLGKDYDATIVALRNLLHGLGFKRLCALGNCEGGFGAIRYGVELGADRIAAFGAPTYSPQDDPLTKLEQARNFMRNRLAASVPIEMMDLRGFLETRRTTAQIDLYYKAESTRDAIHAKHLSGLPGIRLQPQPELGHRLVRGLGLSSEDFSGTLAKLLGIEAAGQASD